jgi:hypothetical protein
MKQWSLILFTLVIFLTESVSAQENVLKTGITNAFFGDFNLSYERVINEKSSIQARVGYLNFMSSFTVSEDWITPEALTLQKDKGGFHASVEYRFYLSKNENSPRGLYLAPFFRHFNQRLLYTDEIDNDMFDVDVKVSNFGLGGQFGYQLIINDVFTLDFYCMGMSLDHYLGKIKYTLQQPRTGFDYHSITDDVDSGFDDIKYLQKKLEHDPQKDFHNSRLPFFAPGIRIGVSAGFAF